MRKREREITDLSEIRSILEQCKILHLGLSDEGQPYVVPLNYGCLMEGEKLTFYLHGATEYPLPWNVTLYHLKEKLHASTACHTAALWEKALPPL